MAGGAATWRLVVRRMGHSALREAVIAEAGQLQPDACMAKVILKDLKKVYPNTEKKKKAKKGEEPEKKSNLQITDEGVVAVQQFNLEIADKEFIVLVGPSGCGKSTTLRMIAGLEEITSGELWIGDKLMNDVEPKDRDIAMVFQNYALYPHMTVYENMAFSLKLRKVPKDEIDQKVPRGCGDPGHHPVSGPQAQGSVRRPAPACGHRPRHRPRPRRVPDGRAPVQPGRQAPQSDARRDHQAAPAHRHHICLRDSRPD